LAEPDWKATRARLAAEELEAELGLLTVPPLEVPEEKKAQD
jgi:hypothetical protein